MNPQEIVVGGTLKPDGTLELDRKPGGGYGNGLGPP
jgi:hypothetical protein